MGDGIWGQAIDSQGACAPCILLDPPKTRTPTTHKTTNKVPTCWKRGSSTISARISGRKRPSLFLFCVGFDNIVGMWVVG